MPEHPLRVRTKGSLPEGYQFGDAGKPSIAIRFLQQWDRVPDDFQEGDGVPWWRVVDGVLTRVQKREVWRSMCENAAEQLARHADPDSWNVIEGDH